MAYSSFVQDGCLSDMAVASVVNAPEQVRLGLVTVFTGDGKGKTTAAIGTAVRAAGHGLKVCIIFFFKGEMYSQGEVNTLGSLSNIDIHCFGVTDWIKKEGDNSVAAKQAQQALSTAGKMIASGHYDLVIMDEVNNAVDFGLIDSQDVLDILRTRPAKVDVLLTGRNADQRITAVADVVTEMQCVKHAFERGIGARLGIDY